MATYNIIFGNNDFLRQLALAHVADFILLELRFKTLLFFFLLALGLWFEKKQNVRF